MMYWVVMLRWSMNDVLGCDVEVDNECCVVLCCVVMLRLMLNVVLCCEVEVEYE